MKCPLLTIGLSVLITKEATEMEDCIKGECEWWSKDVEGCEVTLVAAALEVIAGMLEEIKDKMPKWEQFGKK